MHAYLAKRYGADAPLRPGTRTKRVKLTKEAKKKQDVGIAGAMKVMDEDDDAIGPWNQVVDDEEEDAPVVVSTSMKEKRAAAAESETRKSAWKPIGFTHDDDMNEAEERVINTLEKQHLVGRMQKDTMALSERMIPQAASEATLLEAELRMSSGARAGLQTAKQLSKDIATHKQNQAQDVSLVSQEETVYRDRHGKRIDVAAAKADLAAEKRKALEREEREMEWGKGRVQRKNVEEERQREREVAAGPLARYADDEEVNQALKERERWNDPAAHFLKTKSAKVQMPKYQGPPAPPNRFGILPGYRWDGVDRGNGFEQQFLRHKADKAARQREAYKWSSADM